ncbi:probable galacturonosyltransferase 6 [Aristolochia californica]|uniref:probable galacturonosyltransferase 6 n=1 Tax=Aristolochia californica TaxID=171875 RepID=UPI0035DF6A05
MQSSSGQGFPSQSGLSRRSISSSIPSKPPPPGPLHLDIDPAPKPWPIAQFLALAAIFLFASLQFLPPTHFRDPYDPFRYWIPFNSDSSSNSGFFGEESQNVTLPKFEYPETIHVVSWLECLDLRMLAVLANSTLSNSRDPQRIHFHFFTPEGDKDKVSYYKLKVLFPHSELEIFGHKEVEETLKVTTSGTLQSGPSIHAIAPFVIPNILPSLRKFIYISPDTIVKGRVEELLEVDLNKYAIAAPEDCCKSLGAFLNFDILDAIQRTAAKPWVSTKPYDKNACVPDLNVLVVDAKKSDPDLVEVILWWSRVLNLGNQRSEIHPAIVLALHDKTFKLPSEWKKDDVKEPLTGNGTKIITYDGPRKRCSGQENLDQDGQGSNSWEKYLPPSSNSIVRA